MPVKGTAVIKGKSAQLGSKTMNRFSQWSAFALACSLTACGIEGDPSLNAAQDSLEAQGAHGLDEPPVLGEHKARGEARASKPGGGGSSPNLKLYGGGVLSNPTAVTAIFWGPKWADATFTADKQTGLGQLYSAVGNTAYARTNGEYAGIDGQLVSTDVSYAGQIVDTSATPRSAPSTGTVLAKVCAQIVSPSANAYYPVYTDIPRGHNGYCAWHSWGSCSGVPVQFGFFFALDGDSGCDPQDSTPGRSQGLAALANVSGHELSETLTDPRGTGWMDSSGSENGDKCAWMFDQPVTLSDGSTWKIQGNWSNAAYNAGTGFPNLSGQKGCLYNN
jgi:hypothetical protein